MTTANCELTTANLVVIPLMSLVVACLLTIVWFAAERFFRISTAEAKERARRVLAEEYRAILTAKIKLRQYSKCPECETTDGIIGTREDCMDILFVRCDHAWHKLEYIAWGCETEMGTRARAALLDYGRSLRRKS